MFDELGVVLELVVNVGILLAFLVLPVWVVHVACWAVFVPLQEHIHVLFYTSACAAGCTGQKHRSVVLFWLRCGVRPPVWADHCAAHLVLDGEET